MTESHTPGPWSVEKVSGVDYRICAEDDGGRPVCWIGANRLEHVNDRNARLISAAPDLLKALERCQAILKTNLSKLLKHNDPEIGKQMFLDFLRSVDAAITKAGGTP